MKFRPIVFIGSSAPEIWSCDFLKDFLDVRAPIRRGDLDALKGYPAPICIIDGVFQQSLAISAREILDLLKNQAIVYGCSSMGALRAVELESYGMIGSGEVFKMYRNKEIQSDAEVALVFDPITYENVSLPLVSIRYGLKRASMEGIVSEEECNGLLDALKMIHFSELTWQRFYQTLHEVSGDASLISMKLFSERNPGVFDVKASDAKQLLSTFLEKEAADKLLEIKHTGSFL